MDEELARTSLEKGYLKEAAFDFHQATERFYHTLFLVRTLHSPNTQNLNRLRSQAEALEPGLRDVWPGTNKFERRCYEVLRAAYVKARYSRQYRITAEELGWTASRVEVLRGLIEELCLKRLDALRTAA